MIIGFTGTREALAQPQLRALIDWFSRRDFGRLLHGACIGADTMAHEVALSFGWQIEIYPPTDTYAQGVCLGATVIHPPQSFIKRNHALVDACHTLLAAPRTANEELRSGTWATVRYARTLGREIHMILPDGSHRRELGAEVLQKTLRRGS